MAKTEKTTMRKSLLVDYFGDIIGEKDNKLSVNACGMEFELVFTNCRCAIDFVKVSRKPYIYKLFNNY